MLKIELFDFHLPPELIAQKPVTPRDHCRLLVVDRGQKTLAHRIFFQIEEYLHPGDVLVINESRVLPARFVAHKEGSGGKVEVLFLREQEGRWECLVSPRKKVRLGQTLVLKEHPEYRFLLEEDHKDTWFVRPLFALSPEEFLRRFGAIPLPPYIKAKGIPLEEYQTVYARVSGSVASPTAGLHFTPQLLSRLKEKGVRILSLILHVGLGTFQPVKEGEVEKHRMHREWFFLPQEMAQSILEAKGAGNKVVAVGTTSVRVLESVWQRWGTLREDHGETDLFIYPGFHFGVVDALITNFHLPRSTLFMLVCAFGGIEFMHHAYQEAIREGYRFYSFGDAMFIR